MIVEALGSRGRHWLLAATLVAFLVVAAGGEAQEVTFARDVAPILQENCQSCHREGGMGPMELLTYEQVRRYSARIRVKVAARQMPPWHIDPGIGIQEFTNDVSLTDEEIATVVRWADNGAPLGDPADMPAPVVWNDSGVWKLEKQFGRPPDLVVKSPPYTVPAQGLDQWYEPVSHIAELQEERWAMAAEIRPASEKSRYVFHHANSILVGSAAGKDYDVYPSDSGRRLEVNQRVDWQMHFFPIGEEVRDAAVEVGVWLYPRGVEPELRPS